MVKFPFLGSDQFGNHSDEITPHSAAKAAIVQHHNIFSTSSFCGDQRTVDVNFTELQSRRKHDTLITEITK